MKSLPGVHGSVPVQEPHQQGAGQMTPKTQKGHWDAQVREGEEDIQPIFLEVSINFSINKRLSFSFYLFVFCSLEVNILGSRDGFLVVF